jgi:DNA-binding response OmpR family regulator
MAGKSEKQEEMTVVEEAGFLVVHIDDDPFVRAMMRTYLQSPKLRCQVVSAGSVREGIALLQSEEQLPVPPRLILVDKDLGDGTGFEVLSYLRTCSRMSGVPVIMVTAEPAAAAEALNLGAVEVIDKASWTTRLQPIIAALSSGEGASWQ